MEGDRSVTAEDVRRAAAVIGSQVHRTPVLTSAILDSLAGEGKRVFFKCEPFQKTGSFKARGATNAITRLCEQHDSPVVVTHSSGNHAQAVAWSAEQRGIRAYVVMPHTAPAPKRAAVEGYGAHVVLCEPTSEARTATADRLVQEHNGHFIHPSNDPLVIAGQGTVGLELLEQAREMLGAEQQLDTIIVPLGGGGLIGGIATMAKAINPAIRVIGAEPAAADDAFRSKLAGEIQGHASPPKTIADGLMTCLGSNTWPIVRDLVDHIITVDERQISHAMRLVWQHLKVVIEPSAGVGVAVLFSEQLKALVPDSERIGVVLCGGNVDLDQLPSIFALSAPSGDT